MYYTAYFNPIKFMNVFLLPPKNSKTIISSKLCLVPLTVTLYNHFRRKATFFRHFGTNDAYKGIKDRKSVV